jgi:predicted aspartyl protease
LIAGSVGENGIPAIEIEIGGTTWKAIIDIGFNGDLELPQRLRPHVNAQFVGRSQSLLAADQTIEEDFYLVDFQFDGQAVRVEASFVESDELLIGTGLLQGHHLHIDFPSRALTLQIA